MWLKLICWCLDAKVLVHFPKCITNCGEITAEVLHHILNAPGVLQQVNALGIWVIIDRERPLDRFGKFPAERCHFTSKVLILPNSLNLLINV